MITFERSTPDFSSRINLAEGEAVFAAIAAKTPAAPPPITTKSYIFAKIILFSY
jgi:hypothetical protein